MFNNKSKGTAGFILAFILVACASATPTEAPTIPTRIPATSTTTPTSVLPTPTTTLPAPSPLSEEGPWLVHWDYDSKETFLTNLDGTGLLHIKLPTSYSLLHAPRENLQKHNLASLRVFESGNPFSGRPNINDEVSWVLIHLPEGEIVKTLPTIALEAKPALEELEDTYNIASVLQYSPGHWSPDGRYFAYSAISTGPSVDLHIYDVMLDQVSVLTSEPTHEVVDSWNPDSQRIIHQSGERFHYAWARMTGTQLIGSITLAGISTESPDGPDTDGQIFHWLSNDEFLMYDWTHEGLDQDIHKINLSKGQSSMVYPGPFLDFAYNPTENEYMFVVRPAEYGEWEPHLPDGIYLMENDTLEMELVLPGQYLEIIFNIHFDVYEVHSGKDRTITYLDKDGSTICSRPWSNIDEFSPNGLWVLERSDFDLESQLYNRNCQLVMKTNYVGDDLWLPDSSGFYIHGDVIVRFLEENNWQPEIINENPTFYGFDNVIYP